MSLSRMNQSVIGDTDSYKVSHKPQLPPGTTHIYSYGESRGGEFPYSVFFGLYYLLVEYFETPITQTDVDYFENLFAAHFGDNTLYQKGDWQAILDDYEGRLPISIRAVPEGTVVPVSNVLYTIENLDERFPWLTNYLETMVSRLWYPTTVATLSRRAKEIIAQYMELSGADLAGLPFKLHDFGARGTTCREQAAIGGAAHLINFMGTDTVQGLMFAMAYYGADMPGFSIPAAEHSTITSWGREGELDAYRNQIKQFGNNGSGLFAVVSDSWDILNACDIWGVDLLEEVRSVPGMLVVRPDSGEVVAVVLAVLHRLGEHFGTTTNSKGYRTLNDVRVIQGDGMSLTMIETLCKAVTDAGWSIENIAMGMGGGLLQNVNRDTQKAAIKCSATIRNGVEYEVFKEPVTDTGKFSKRGRLSLVRDAITGEYSTQNWYEVADEDDLLVEVYRNGRYIADPPLFSEIRERAQINVLKEVLV